MTLFNMIMTPLGEILLARISLSRGIFRQYYPSLYPHTDVFRHEGRLTRRVILMVLEWAFHHRDTLYENWELIRMNQPLKKNSTVKIGGSYEITSQSDRGKMS